MAKIIGGSRGSGKTTQLVMESHETGLYIVCMDRNRAQIIMDVAKGLRLNIPFPITVDEFILSGSRINKVLVDDIEDVLTKFMGIPIEMASTSMSFTKLSMGDEIKPTKNLTMGQAIDWYLKQGRKAKRKHWDEGIFIYMVRGQQIAKGNLRNEALDHNNVGIHDHEPIIINAHIDMKTADGSIIVGWLASQADMFAEDWEVL